VRNPGVWLAWRLLRVLRKDSRRFCFSSEIPDGLGQFPCSFSKEFRRGLSFPGMLLWAPATSRKKWRGWASTKDAGSRGAANI